MRQLAPFVEVARLVADDGARAERFGFAVALDDDTLVVGSRNARVGSNGDEGAVYVYLRTGTTYALQAKLTASDGAANDHFGSAVAIAGDTIAVGSPFHNNPAADQGAVYVFTRSGTTWTQRARVAALGGVVNERFGIAVAIGGDTVAVGAPFDSRNANDRGAVYVFTGSGATWTQQARLVASDGAVADQFGFSVAVSGNAVLAGAPYRDLAGMDDVGGAYVFRRSGSTWTQEQRLLALSSRGEDHFGWAVALEGAEAFVGAPDRDELRRDQGAVYAYVHTAGIWLQAQKLTVAPGDEANDAAFGSALAVESGTLVVGAPSNRANASHQGLVYTFSGGEGAWVPRQILTAANDSRDAHLGYAVAISGGRIAAGAPDDDIPRRDNSSLTNPEQGSVSVFGLLAAVDDHYSVDQGTTLAIAPAGVLTNDGNPAGATLIAQLVTGPAHGTLTLRTDGSFTYVPGQEFSGADSFTYRSNDGTSASNIATVTITVRPRPVANPDAYSTNQDIALQVAATDGVLANDVSGSGGSLTAVRGTGPQHGTLNLNSDGSFGYTPAAGYSGPDSFTYTAREGTNDSVPATVSITVKPAPPQPPTPPVARDDSYATDAGTALTVSVAAGVLANDSGSDLSASVLTPPTHGALSLQAGGSFSYTPAAGFTGSDSFSYRATNGGGSDDATVSITVRAPPNRPPVAADDTYTTTQDTPLIVVPNGVLANDSDPDRCPVRRDAASSEQPRPRAALARRWRRLQLQP